MRGHGLEVLRVLLPVLSAAEQSTRHILRDVTCFWSECGRDEVSRKPTYITGMT